MSYGNYYGQSSYPSNSLLLNQTYPFNSLLTNQINPNSTNNQLQSLPIVKHDLGSTFAKQFKKLQQVEDQLQQYRTCKLPKINHQQQSSARSPYDYDQIMQECNDKKAYHEQITNNNLEEKFEAMKLIHKPTSKIKERQLTQEEKNKLIEMEYENIDMKGWKKTMKESLTMICNTIKGDLENEKNKASHFQEIIQKNINELKTGMLHQVTDYDLMSRASLKEMRKVMLKSNTRMKYLAKKVFPKGEADREVEEEERREEEEKKKLNQVKRMSLLITQNNQDVLAETRKKYEEEHKDVINSLSDSNSSSGGAGGSISNCKGSNKCGLDLRDRHRLIEKNQLNKISIRLMTYTPIYDNFRPLNKLRSYIYFLIAAKRILNVQYNLYSKLKFDNVHYFIENYEDMDIILKKLVFTSIKPAISDLFNKKRLDINIVIKKSNAHDLFLILKDMLSSIIEGLSKNFFEGISNNMLTFLSLFITNYSYIPRDFYTTFELVRFRMTTTGEMIELERDQQRMILGFYIIIKILMKNLFLELLFNERQLNIIDLRTKLNIKMIVSVLYRGIIEEFKKCTTQRNMTELEIDEDVMNYTKVSYVKKEFLLMRDVKRKRIKKGKDIENDKQDNNNSNLIIKKKKKINSKSKSRSKSKAKKGKGINNLQIIKDVSPSNEGSAYNDDNYYNVDPLTKKKKIKKQRINAVTEGNMPNIHPFYYQQNHDNMENDYEQYSSQLKKKKKKRNIQQMQIIDVNENDYDMPQKALQKKKKKRRISSKKRRNPEVVERIAPRRPPPINQNITSDPNDNQLHSLNQAITTRPRSNFNDNEKENMMHYDSKVIQLKKAGGLKKPKLNNKKRSKSKSLTKSKSKPKSLTKSKPTSQSKSLTKSKSKPKSLTKSKSKPKSLTKSKSLAKGQTNKSRHKVKMPFKKKTNLNKTNTPKLNQEFTGDETEIMNNIISNLQSFGEDTNPSEFELIDQVVYHNEYLKTYELFREEYTFEPIKPIMDFLDKLLDLIISNFNNQI